MCYLFLNDFKKGLGSLLYRIYLCSSPEKFRPGEPILMFLFHISIWFSLWSSFFFNLKICKYFRTYEICRHAPQRAPRVRAPARARRRRRALAGARRALAQPRLRTNRRPLRFLLRQLAPGPAVGRPRAEAAVLTRSPLPYFICSKKKLWFVCDSYES